MPEVEPMGPISYLVVEFPNNQFTGEAFPALMDLVDRGLVRILDLQFVMKGEDGSIQSLEVGDIDGDGTFDFAIFEGAKSGLLDAGDLDEAGGAMNPGSSAGILIVENRWATPFVQGLRNSGAQLIAAGFIPQDMLDTALATAEAVG